MPLRLLTCPRRAVVAFLALLAIGGEVRLAQGADGHRPGMVRIALIGDSTMASYPEPPADRPDLTGWGQVFGEFFDSRVEILNQAVSGRSSKSFLKENRWKPVLDAKPDYVFIQFGHNDQPGKEDRTTDPETEFRDNLRFYVREARAAQVKPVLVTPVGRRTFADGKATSNLGPYVSATRIVAREEHVPVVDLHAASVALYNLLGDAGSAELSASADDRTHFSRRGGLAIAGLVSATLPVTVPDLARHLRHEVISDAIPAAVDFPGRLRLSLPDTIDAVVGLEANIYFDNLVLTTDSANYAFDVHCPKGRHEEERWTLTPVVGDVGVYPLVVEVRDDQNRVVARARTQLRVHPADAGNGRDLTLLFVGDSLTHASVYPRHVLDLGAKDGNPRLKLIGSHQPAGVPDTVRHEGYGGWTALRFATHATGTPREGEYAKRASPFLYPGADGKPALDFKAYCRDVNGGTPPDVVSIFLGPNDIYGDTDETIEGGVERMLRHMDLLVGMVRRDAPETDVALLLPVPPAASQDAFGSNYGTSQTRWQYRRNQHRLVERMLAQYGGREPERIHLIATEVNLDCRHNYPAAEVTWNANTPLKGLRQNNGVHPAATGYQQTGDTVFAWLKGRK